MALIQYNQFYRMYGVRRLGQLTNPPLPMLSRLALPQNSYYHYIGTGPLDDGPTENEAALIKQKNRPFALVTVSDLSSHEGNPRRLTIQVDRAIRQFRNKNPRFRPMRDLETTERDPQTIGVFNYSYLHRLYRYPRNIYSNFNRWKNIHDTVWSRMAEVAQNSDRYQFIEFDLPRVLPSIGMLNQMEGSPNQKLVAMFSSSENMILLEIWKWLGENRQDSLISKIPPNKYDRINLIFKESNRWLVINLGQLNEWRKPSKREAEENPSLPKMGNDPVRMQRFFLRLAMSLTAARDDSVPENLGNENEPSKDQVNAENQLAKSATPALAKTDEKTGRTTIKPLTPEQASPTLQPEVDSDAFLGTAEREEREEDRFNRDAAVVDQGNDVPDEQDRREMEKQIFSSDIDDDLASLNEIAENVYKEDTSTIANIEYAPPEPKSPEEAIIAHANALADSGGWSVTEYKRALENAGKYKTLTAPDGGTLGDFLKIHPDTIKIHPDKVTTIPDRQTIADKTMLKSSLLDFDKNYVTNVMQKDIANMVVSMQNAGVLIQDYRVHEQEDITGGRMEYTVRVKPLQGIPSTLRFRMPKVEPDGSLRINGVTYRTRKQRGDLPIRKLTPSRVALTSYYGKVFVERSSKKVNDYGRWIRDNIMALALADNPTIVTWAEQGIAFDPSYEAPRLYTMIAQDIRGFNLRVTRNGEQAEWRLIFDHNKIKTMFSASENPEEAIRRIESLGPDGMGKTVIIGMTDKGRVLVMDMNNAIYEVLPNNTLAPMPTLEELLGIAGLKAPVEFAEVRIFGKMVPVGVVLGYLMGLEELCKRLGVKPLVVPAGQRTGMVPGQWMLQFQDETWIFNRDDVVASLVMGGWREYRDSVITYDHHMFNQRDVYLNILEENGLSVRYLREMDLLAQMFIDPITKELLEYMKEPQVFTELLIRAAALLENDQHPHELDARYMRIKGYERYPGLLYQELIKCLRVHNAKGAKALHALEINPYAVWTQISEDPAKDQALEINPIKEMKEIEAVTYSGTGGRSGRSMVKRTRAYHPTDTGLISEATSDSSDVGINVFLTANPKFNSLRGTSDPYDFKKPNPTSGLSTSVLVSPAADRDDMKRANFISIQHAHGMACEGYHQAQVRTGYEQVIPFRVGPTYAVMAKKNGKVTSLTPTGIIAQYDDGELIGVEIGRKYGNASGLTIPHEIVTPLTNGETFQAGAPIAYNSGFFEPDFFDPKAIVWKSSTSARTVLLESTDTLEDSCAISQSLSSKLKTRITKMRTVIVNFGQQIHDIVSIGQEVEYDSILCVIEDAVSASSGMLDPSSISTLRALTSQTPKAKIRGKIERIEVFYHGEKEDMSSTLRAIANDSDYRLTSRLRSQGKKAYNGRVDENYRVENDSLQLDTAAINVYISAEVSAGVGDKGVFGNQLKTVFGRVFPDNIRTESGKKIEAVFGAKSVDDRVVMSPFIIGTTATLLDVIGKKAVEIYKS